MIGARFETERPFDEVDIDEPVDLVVGEAILQPFAAASLMIMTIAALVPKEAMRPLMANAVTLWRDYCRKVAKLHAKRAGTTRAGRSRPVDASALRRHLLVDGMWDNPNFWLRYSLLRASLGWHSREWD